MMGSWGTGKTKAWIDIAERSDATFYVVDTDRTVERMLEDRRMAKQPVVSEAYEWLDVKKALAEFGKQGGKNDWLVIDMADKPWEWVQNYLSMAKTGADIAERWMAHDKKGHIFTDIDWQTTNAQFATYFYRPILQWPGHLFFCTPVDTITREGRFADNQETIGIYGRFNAKPRGQKHLAHYTHTVLLAQQSGDGWKLTTVKDRGRRYLNQSPYEDFVASYMIPVAGWKL